MIERVKTFIDQKKLMSSADKVLVAVSGGVDSMVLFHMLKILGFTLSVAHMNFKLREDADQDEVWIKAWCLSHEITCHTTQVNTKEQSNTEGESIQMTARKLRYEWFGELAENHSYTKIVTAHHLNDSLETVLLNLCKGTGTEGLRGIAPITGIIVRPMLEISKREILDFASREQIEWREDSSNLETKYQRNLIRNMVIPQLEKVNPSLIQTFRHTLERLEGANELIRRQVADIIHTHLSLGREHRLSLSWFKKSEGHLVLLSEILKSYGVWYTLARDIGDVHESGKTFLTSTHQLVYDRNQLIIVPRGLDEKTSIKIHDQFGSYVWGSKSIHLTYLESRDFVSDAATAYFDMSNIRFPIIVRNWKEGDWLVPLGMSGKKKLSDFMIDRKIPLTLKDNIPVFESNGDIFWVGGYQIDNRYKVTGQSENILQIKIDHRD